MSEGSSVLRSEGPSSSGLAPSSSSSIPRPSTSPSFSLRPMTEGEEETYKIACCEAGVWAQVEEHMAAVVAETQLKAEPSVELESPPLGAWVCRACTSWVSRRKLYCSREGCPTRRELMQKWKPGDLLLHSVWQSSVQGQQPLPMGALPLQ